MLSWRERFLIRCGPGVLAGITLGDWLKLLGDNRFSVDSPYLLRAASVSVAAVTNSIFRWHEEHRYGRNWKDLPVPPPLFVLGHWRSGTTHLHYLLGLDDRFAFPNFYQVIYPHTFLSTERWFSGPTAFLLPERRAYDNVRLDLTVPCEDEFAMCVAGFMTPYLTGVFPRRAAHYDQFLSFRDAPPRAVAQWQSSLRLFLQKLTLRHGKRLIIKSPAHTCRIRLLLEMFPGAKFVHIHRDPYTVFQSMVHTYETGLPFGRLQRTDEVDWTERVIRQYRELYDAFFEERGLIPGGHFHEMSFEALENDPVGELRKLYEALNLPQFGNVESNVRTYVRSLLGYRKNKFPELASDVRRRIAREWRRSFDEWGYAV
jgi:omega-hydroxy-beta-dihydromenaquinone-9 sulfotransferase